MRYARYKNLDWALELLDAAIERFNSSADVRLLYPKATGKFSSAGPVSERTIAHRLAVHLETEIHLLRDKELSDLTVDCEYNRHGQAVKALDVEHRLKHIVQELNRNLRKNPNWRRWYSFSIFPDIVLHERTIDDGNLIVIELKRASNDLVEEQEYDDLKLRLLTRRSDYGYDYSLGAGVTAIDCGPRSSRQLRTRVLYSRGQRVRHRR
jgi:hypothetical protein